MLSKTLTCTPALFGRLQVNRRLPKMITRSGGGHHGPMMPPFARLKPPTSSIPLETELVWDDSVAPETCVDFDAPHVSTSDVLISFLAGLGFFGSVYLLVYISDPEKNRPVAPRSAIISNESFMYSMGFDVSKEAMAKMGFEVSDVDDEEEEEDDE